MDAVRQASERLGGTDARRNRSPRATAASAIARPKPPEAPVTNQTRCSTLLFNTAPEASAAGLLTNRTSVFSYRPGRYHADRAGQLGPGRLELGDVPGLENQLQVEDPGIKRLELRWCRPPHGMGPRLAGTRRDFRYGLADQALMVEPTLAGDDRAGGAHARVEADRVQHEPAPGTSSAPNAAHRPPANPPAAPVIGTPRGSRRIRCASRAAPSLSLSHLTSSSDRPLLGSEHSRRVLERRRTSHSTVRLAGTGSAPGPAAQSLHCTRAAVGRAAAARRDVDVRHPRGHGGRKQLAGAVRRCRDRITLSPRPPAPVRWPPPSRPPRRHRRHQTQPRSTARAGP